jgi:hypothetical protein
MTQAFHLNDARVLKSQRTLHACFDQGERAFDNAAGAAERVREWWAGEGTHMKISNLRTSTPMKKFCKCVGATGWVEASLLEAESFMELYCVDVNDASLSRTDKPRQLPTAPPVGIENSHQ